MSQSAHVTRRMPWGYHPRLPLIASGAGLVLLVTGLLTTHFPSKDTGTAMMFGLETGIAVAYCAKYFMVKHCRELASGAKIQCYVGLVVIPFSSVLGTLHASVLVGMGAWLLPCVLASPEQKAVWLEARRLRGMR